MDQQMIVKLLRVVLVAGKRDDCPTTDQIADCVYGEDRQRQEVWAHIFDCKSCAMEALLFEYWDAMKFTPAEVEQREADLKDAHFSAADAQNFWELSFAERAAYILHVASCEACALLLKRQTH